MFRKVILMTILLLAAIWCDAQLVTKSQVTAMIKTATDPLVVRITSLEKRVKVLEDSLKTFNRVIIDTVTSVNGIKLSAVKQNNIYLLKLKARQ